MIEVRPALPDELDRCLAVRRDVFVVGQNVPEDLEVDGLDEACWHALALEDDHPVGTARLRTTSDGVAKVERVAVLDSYRGKHVGDRLMTLLENEAKARGHKEVVLSAQKQVIPFYERRGYLAFGPEYLEADIPHRKMRRALDEAHS